MRNVIYTRNHTLHTNNAIRPTGSHAPKRHRKHQKFAKLGNATGSQAALHPVKHWHDGTKCTLTILGVYVTSCCVHAVCRSTLACRHTLSLTQLMGVFQLLPAKAYVVNGVRP